MLIIPEREMAGLLTPSLAFDAVEQMFSAAAKGDAYNFPVVREAIGHEDALYGFKGGFDRSALSLGLKAGGYWPHNMEKRGLINHQSAIFLFDADTGKVKAMLGGNLITALRTAAASSVSVKHLARPDSRVIGMVGAGHQSAFQLRAALQQRSFERIIGWNRSPEKLNQLKQVADEHAIAFEAVPLGAMREADVIITIMSCFEAVLDVAHVSAGTHIACMGTDTKGKQEVAPALLKKAALFTDEVAQSRMIGEAQHAISQGLVADSDLAEIGAVINGTHPGRRHADDITLFDGTGTGLQDLAVANAVLAIAQEKGSAIEAEF